MHMCRKMARIKPLGIVQKQIIRHYLIAAMKPDTAGCFVRLRETSVVCMRLEEEEEEDGTLLMLMRELSVFCDQHRRTDCQMMELFSPISTPFCSVVDLKMGRSG